MAERLQRTSLVPPLDDGGELGVSLATWRLVIWGTAAFAAVGLAFTSLILDDGGSRVTRGHADAAGALAPAAAKALPPHPAESDQETHRLSDAVRLLAADRDRLQVRLSALERHLGDVTGSTTVPPSVAPANPPPAAAPAAEVPAAPPPATPAPSGTASLSASGLPFPSATFVDPIQLQQLQALSELPRAAASAARATPEPVAASPPPLEARFPPAREAGSTDAIAEPAGSGSVATRTEFGVDLGGAATVSKLRALWQSLRENREALFDGLHPVIAVRESARGGAVDLRLIVGPLTDAQAAARLCATLAAAGLSCQTSVFDGQRLALK